MMKKTKIWLSSILIALSIGCAPSLMAANSDAITQKIILDEINAYRVKHGLSQLKMVNTISLEARNHSVDMADKAVPFGHDLFEKRAHRLLREFNNSRGIAENVAYCYGGGDADTLVKLWLTSPGHLRNIKGNYNLTGIGVVHDKKGGVYATQIFLRAS